jgi:hypothetical protein
MLRTALSFVFAFSLVVTLTACQSGAGETSDPEPVLIAVVELDSYSAFPSPTQMGPMLEAGEPYRITVEGTYSVWDLSTTTVELCKGDDEQIADSVASDNYGVLKIEVHGFE